MKFNLLIPENYALILGQKVLGNDKVFTELPLPHKIFLYFVQ